MLAGQWFRLQIQTSLPSAVPAGPLLLAGTFYSIHYLCKRGCAGWSGPSVSSYIRRHLFVRHGPVYVSAAQKTKIIIYTVHIPRLTRAIWYKYSPVRYIFGFQFFIPPTVVQYDYIWNHLCRVDSFKLFLWTGPFPVEMVVWLGFIIALFI